MLDAAMCKTHFYCDWCDPQPVEGEGNIFGTVLLWIGVTILIVGAWTLLG